MSTLAGMNGSNPRDFLAALGLLRILVVSHPHARLSFRDDGAYAPEISGVVPEDLVDVVLQDATNHAGPQPWRLEYEKTEKRGAKRVADLKAPPALFRSFIDSAVSSWASGHREGAAYAAAYATDVALDGKGNTKPTAFHFTAANQQFLDTVERVRGSIDRGWCEAALFTGNADRSGPNLRWDPAADRAYALMANNPNDSGTIVNAPLEWLAFRALPLVPVVPRGSRVETTGVRRRGDQMRYRWPLWSTPASLSVIASVVRLNWWEAPMEQVAFGVFAICTCEIRRTAQGFGNFGPAEITT